MASRRKRNQRDKRAPVPDFDDVPDSGQEGVTR